MCEGRGYLWIGYRGYCCQVSVGRKCGGGDKQGGGVVVTVVCSVV